MSPPPVPIQKVHHDGLRLRAIPHERPRIPGSKTLRAKQLIAAGKSLAEAAAAVDLTPEQLDLELWRLLGFRLESRP